MKRLFVVFLFVCIGVLAGCGPVVPPSAEPCVSCQGDKCVSGFRCLRGFCVSETGVELPCTLPEKQTIVLGKERTKSPVAGCKEGETSICFAPNALCREGKTTCVGGYWERCVFSGLSKEGTSCEAGKGICLAVGVWRCDETGGFSWVCDAVPTSPLEERCNGKDDDCDGLVDEDVTESCFDGPAAARGVGHCRAGVATCTQGSWGPCVGQQTPVPETCNGKDDDCDGKVDEELVRACYRGPKGTAGLGVCREGQQRCEQGAWKPCEGDVYPKDGETCVPTLEHVITTSLLQCLASAQAQECVPGGTCKTTGSKAEKEERGRDKTLLARCRGSHTETCGTYSAEAVIRRETEDLKTTPGQVHAGGFRLRIAGFVGSCACNSWCRNGCAAGSGCCLTCNILARDCQASSTYVAYHTLSWKDALPVSHPVVLHVETLEGNPTTVSLQDKGTQKSLVVKQDLRCLMPLTKEGSTLLFNNTLGITCADAFDFQLVLVVRPWHGNESLPSCF